MKITPDYIKAQVASTSYAYDGTHTTCTIVTKAGIRLVGTSGCLDERNYVKEVGEQLAYKRAEDQLWQLEGYVFAKLQVADSDLVTHPSLEVAQIKFSWAKTDEAPTNPGLTD